MIESGMMKRIDDLPVIKGTMEHRYFSPQGWSLEITKDGYIFLRENIGMIPLLHEFERMVAECRKFYENHSDSDISDYNLSCLREERGLGADTPTKQPVKKDDSGYLYLIKSSSGHYKIGKSKNPKRRLSELKNGLTLGPYEIELDCCWYVNNMSKAEDHYHALFSDCRVSGEWFALSHEQVEQIKQEN